jgi:hypothetical protein
MGEVAYLEVVTKRNVEELFYRVKTNDKKSFRASLLYLFSAIK